MTAPDSPVVKVAGPSFTSEAVLILTTVGGFLAAVFGQDWGMRAHAQDIASAAAVLAPLVLALVRAAKHRGAQRANTAVTVARLQQPVQSVFTVGQPTFTNPPPASINYTITNPPPLADPPEAPEQVSDL